MAALTCDICGGQLSMDPSGEFAICDSCGMKHTKDRVKAKAQEITGTVKIDDSDSVKEQISNWEKMAGDAFNNSNYSEAYNYYCKILEKKVGYWFATYRKGMCLGWQANLKNMHTNEVLGGIVDGTKLLLSDEMQSDSLKANGKAIMAVELYNWIQAINNLAVNHCNEFGNQLVSAAREFYQQECLVAELTKFNMGMIDEFVYQNYEDKKGLENVVNAICSMARTIATNMNASFRIKTGSKYNTFWQIYEDVYEDVSPDYKTQTAKNELNTAATTLQNNFRTWKSNYERMLAEKERKEKEERKTKYWEAHAEDKRNYEARLVDINSEINSLQVQADKYNARISEIKKDLSQTVPGEQQLIDLKRKQSDLRNQKSQLGLFAGKKKKELQAQIDIMQPQINDLESSVNRQRQAIQKDVSEKVAAVEFERKPFVDQITALETEKKRINTELTKDR